MKGQKSITNLFRQVKGNFKPFHKGFHFYRFFPPTHSYIYDLPKCKTKPEAKILSVPPRYKVKLPYSSWIIVLLKIRLPSES